MKSENMAHSVPVSLLGLGTAVPETEIDQTDAEALARDLFGDAYPEYDRLARVFETSGIRKRHLVRPVGWYRQPLGWSERTKAFLEGAGALFEQAAGRALKDAGLSAADIDAVVTVSSTGIATPSLEVRSFERLGLKTTTRRYPLFGLGCAGGVSGLAAAADIARGRPGRNVLLVAVELCSLSFRADHLTKANVVATALFGDGAAACILRADPAPGRQPVITVTGEYAWPGTIDLMGWDVDSQGFEVIFARAIPPFAKANMGNAVRAILAGGQLRLPDIDRFICHPGGARVVDALETSLGIASGALDHERAILADYGNMSAPTVLFVLNRVRAAGLPQRSALIAMGPGFTASCAVLETGR